MSAISETIQDLEAIEAKVGTALEVLRLLASGELVLRVQADKPADKPADKTADKTTTAKPHRAKPAAAPEAEPEPESKPERPPTAKAVILKALGERGPLTNTELKAVLQNAGFPSDSSVYVAAGALKDEGLIQKVIHNRLDKWALR